MPQGSRPATLSFTPVVTKLTEKDSTEMATDGKEEDVLITKIAERIAERAANAAFKPSLPIQRVPEVIRNRKKTAYTPRLVSVGPLHYEAKHLKPEIKRYYANALFTRVSMGSEPQRLAVIKECTADMKQWKATAKKRYAERVDKLDEEMLVIDGCFVLEVLYRDRLEQLDESRHTRNSLQHDLLLLENQLPFFVLERLFDLTIKKIQSNGYFLHDYVIWYCHKNMELAPIPKPASDESTNNSSSHRIPIDGDVENSKGVQVQHILHLLHRYYCNGLYPEDKCEGFESDGKRLMPCASKLYCAGIKFVSGTGDHLFNIGINEIGCPFGWFHRPQFQIPIRCTERTEQFLRNLIAFEQCCPYVKPYFSSYAFFMNALIDSAADVDVLVDAGVMQNSFETSEEAASLYNDLTKEVAFDAKRFYFGNICKKAKMYSKRKWARVRFRPAFLILHLSRTYLATPWPFIGFFLAFITVGVTVTNFILSFTLRKPK